MINVLSLDGLWSKLKGLALPWTLRTDRESPAFACHATIGKKMMK
jgi:hypothetical protein